MKQFADLASTQLGTGINDTDTSLVLVDESRFPPSGPFDILLDSELVTVGAISGPNCSDLVRGVGGTTAASHPADAPIPHVLTASALRALRAVVKRKPSSEAVNNSTTYQDDDDLFFAIGANEVWVFEFVLFVTGSTSADIKITLAVPSGATLMSGVHGLVNSSTSSSGSLYAFSGPGDHQFIGTNNLATAMIIYRGIVVNGATLGTCTLQYAQQSPVASDTIVQANSHMVALEAA